MQIKSILYALLSLHIRIQFNYSDPAYYHDNISSQLIPSVKEYFVTQLNDMNLFRCSVDCALW